MEKTEIKCVICKTKTTQKNKRQHTCSNAECKRIYQNMVRRYKRAGRDPKILLLEKSMAITAEQAAGMTDRERWQIMTLAQRNAFAREHGMSYGKMENRMRGAQ